MTRFCCVMLGSCPLRDSYLGHVGPTLASEYVFDFVDFWIWHPALQHAVSCVTGQVSTKLFPKAVNAKISVAVLGSGKVHQRTNGHGHEYGVSGLLLEGLGLETSAITLFIPFRYQWCYVFQPLAQPPVQNVARSSLKMWFATRFHNMASERPPHLNSGDLEQRWFAQRLRLGSQWREGGITDLVLNTTLT